jgi:streptomycin 6-kinase
MIADGRDSASGAVAVHVPRRLASLLVAARGDRASAWLATLPDLVARLGEQWSLGFDARPAAFDDGHSSVVLACRAGGGDAVLKLGLELELVAAEAAALRAWAGSGRAVRLLAAELEVGALLLERLRAARLGPPEPGEHDAVADLLRSLHVPVPPGVPSSVATRWRSWLATADERVAGLDGALGPRARRAIVAAARRLEEETGGPAVLLHGDFWPANVWCRPDGTLLVLDPEPLAGDPEHDAAKWCLRRESYANVELHSARLARAGGYSRERLRDWSLVLAAKHAAWGLHVGELGRAAAPSFAFLARAAR